MVVKEMQNINDGRESQKDLRRGNGNQKGQNGEAEEGRCPTGEGSRR